jgi:drug/metabolite transporter (DMT)-like permease
MGKLFSALTVLSLIWGTSFLFIKVLLSSLHPEVIVFGRCLFGTVMLFIIILLGRQKIQFTKMPLLPLFLVALTNNALPWLLISSSETKLTSGMASIINAATPIWTLIIGSLFFSSSLRKSQWAGILVGFLGIFILSDFRMDDLFSGNLLGIFLMTGATLCYGIGSHLSKKHLAHLSVLETSFITLLFSTVISFFMVLLKSPQSFSTFITSVTIGPFVGLGALGSGVAYLLYYYLVKKGSAEFASLVTYLVPVSAIVWGTLLLNEKIHFSMIVGLLIIFAGVFISTFKPKEKSKATFTA